jgi:hypothetical protein
MPRPTSCKIRSKMPLCVECRASLILYLFHVAGGNKDAAGTDQSAEG